MKIGARRRVLWFAVIVFIALVVGGFLSQSNESHAAIGDSGTAGPTSGGGASGVYAISSNGYGWHKFPVSGERGPRYRKGGSENLEYFNWKLISQQCKKEGDDMVMAFIVLTRPGGSVYEAAVYADDGWTVPGRIESGGGWVSRETARAKFHTLPEAQRRGWPVPGHGRTAWFCYREAPRLPAWSIKGYSVVHNKTSGSRGVNIHAAPGDEVVFYHGLDTTGRFPSNAIYNIDHDYFKEGTSGRPNRDRGLAESGISGPPGKVKDTLRRELLVYPKKRHGYKIQPQDVGRYICQRIAWQPAAPGNSGWGHGGWPCVWVHERPDFNLVPNVRADDTFIAPGAKEVKKVSFSVANTSTKHKSGPAAYAFVWFVVRRGEPVPASSIEFTVPKKPGTGSAVDNWHCHEFTKGHPGRKCESFERNPAGHAFGVNESKRRDQEPHDVAGLGLTPGDSICYASIVNKYQHRKTSFDYRSAVTCVKVAKKPSVQVWGADVRAGVKSSGRGNVVTGRVVSDGRLYGSWAEYGIMARRSVYSSSGAQLAPVGGAPASGDVRTLNPLTFRNTLQPFGNFGVIAASPRHPLGSMPAAGPAKQVAVDGALTSQSYHTLTLTGGTLPKAKRVVLRADTVRITGDVLYTDETIHSAAELPQLVIRARHIIVAEEVRRIDAWLVADGAVSTCGDVADPAQWYKMNVAACDVPLQINGPVHAKQVYLRRTHGATLADPGSPAEIINARPDVYMAEYGKVAGSGAIQTMHIQELPPRL